jgi:molybdopterin molybdotransferase
MANLPSVAEAQQLVLGRVQPLSAETVPVAAAAGRVLAAPGRAVTDLPPFPSSAMDGYAVRSADTPGSLPVVFRIAAGVPASRALEAGEAMAISTGGVVPEGCDAVVPIERVVEEGNVLSVPEHVPNNTNIRGRGGDLRTGDTVVEPGSRLTPARIGALAAAGVAELHVHRRPVVAILATGTELVPPGQPLGPGQVYEANASILAAQAAAAGCEVVRLLAVADDEVAHRAAIERGLACDVLVTSGGVSVGPHDLVRTVEAALGVEEVFWRVSVKPGKPVAFGVRGSTLVFGLPGNPVSSLVSFELFVRPALLALQGVADPLPRFEPAVLGRALRRGLRDELVRARLRVDGALGPAAAAGASAAGAPVPALVADPLTGQDSHMIARSAQADALLWLPAGEGELAAGSIVGAYRLP